MALLRVIRRPQGNEPQQWSADCPEAKRDETDNKDEYPNCDVEDQRLDGMKTDKRPVLLVLHQQDDDGNDGNWVSQRRPKLIITGNIRGFELVRHLCYLHSLLCGCSSRHDYRQDDTMHCTTKLTQCNTIPRVKTPLNC